MGNQAEASNFAAAQTSISQEALDQLFYEARTHSTWLPEAVPVELLRKAYYLINSSRDLLMFGGTAVEPPRC